MLFKEFTKELSKEIRKELPGFSAQKLMAPLGRKESTAYLKNHIAPKISAVLILLYPNANPFSIKTALILRPENKNINHAGQISFPGGKFDQADRNIKETALRETEEEIGLDRKLITIIGELSPLYIPVSNFMVQPFIGITNNTPEFKIQPAEVTELLEIEINEFLSRKNKKNVRRFIKTKGTKINVPCYEIDGKVIWGATAMIISELTEIIKKIR